MRRMKTRLLPVLWTLAWWSCATPAVTVAPAVATVAPIAVDEPLPTLRTSLAVRPTHAHVELTVIPEAPTLSGRIELALEVKAPTSVLWLNATGLKVVEATFDGSPATVVPGNDDFIGLRPSASLKPGPVTLRLSYTGLIDHERSQGLYAQQEPTGETYAYTFFEPTDARRVFPCFDEPGAKIPWSLTLHLKREHVARANTPILSETDEPEGMKRVDFATTRPLPSYLVAFMVGPFEVVDGGTAGRLKTPVAFIIPRGRAAELAYAHDITPKVVTALEDWFDMGYPYVKLDVAVVPRFWGTMEHPGLVAMGQSLTLIKPTEETRERQEAYTGILSHELAHYWFGDLVTTAWWDDTWLNEALGQWMDLNITEAVAPQWHVGDEKRIREATSGMNADELLATQPIRLPVKTREAISSAFDGEVTYSKGASVLRMFEAAVGKPRWRAFLQKWIHTHEDRTATADDFLALARAELGEEVAVGLNSFLTQAGVPLVSGAPVCDGARRGVELRQRRSLPAGVTAPDTRRWSFPVCWRAGDERHSQRLCTTMTQDAHFVPLEFCPRWLVLNDDATGYYRSAITGAQATALLAPSSTARLNSAERLLLLRDLKAAVGRDEVSVGELLALARATQSDPDDRVVLAGLSAAGLRTDPFDDALYERYLAYLRTLAGPRAKRLGWVRAPSDSDDRHAIRQQALAMAAVARDPETTKQAGVWFERWLTTRSGLSDDLVDLALTTAAETSDARNGPGRFDRLLEAARTARDHLERGRLLGVLGHFTEPGLATRARALVEGSEFDLRETSSILYAQLSDRHTRPAAWSWVQGHLDSLLSRMRSDEASWFLAFLGRLFCEPVARAQADALITPRAQAIDGAALTTARGLEQSGQCIANFTRTKPALRAFLSTVK